MLLNNILKQNKGLMSGTFGKTFANGKNIEFSIDSGIFNDSLVVGNSPLKKENKVLIK